MSNAAVILLAQSHRVGSFGALRIEDNFGESIHIHLGDFRFDLSIVEFFSLVDIFVDALVELDGLSKKQLYSDFISDIYHSVNYEKPIFAERNARLSDLKFIHRNIRFRVIEYSSVVPIFETSHFRYLTEGDQTFLHYPQFNAFGQGNKERINRRLELAKEETAVSGLTVFGNHSNIVRDGLHGAAVAAYLYGVNSEVKVVFVCNARRKSIIIIPFFSSLCHTVHVIFFLLKRVLRSVFFYISTVLKS